MIGVKILKNPNKEEWKMGLGTKLNKNNRSEWKRKSNSKDYKVRELYLNRLLR